jgi:F-type H+-transporting ATPase subunit b
VGFEELLGVNPWTALFTLANTVALFLVMKKFLWVPVLKMIEERQQEIDSLYAEAGSAKAEAKAMEEEYRIKLSAAADTSERIVREAVARGQSREEEILRQANAEAAAILDKASADIAQEKKKAINDAKDEISVIALAIAGKVVGRELNGEDQARLVDSFIDELG